MRRREAMLREIVRDRIIIRLRYRSLYTYYYIIRWRLLGVSVARRAARTLNKHNAESYREPATSVAFLSSRSTFYTCSRVLAYPLMYLSTTVHNLSRNQLLTFKLCIIRTSGETATPLVESVVHSAITTCGQILVKGLVASYHRNS